MNKLSNLSKHHYLLIAILVLGCAVRILCIDALPAGLNQDEASSGYEAFSILNYGIDRNGIENPLHLIAWGSGQNIVYSWLCMPFIALMGLSVTAIRLPMAITGCISIYVFYILFKELWDEKYALWGAFFFAVYPWHIMKSRWALDCNIFPDLVLYGSMLLLLFIKHQKHIYLYAAVLTLSFSLYSYGTAYMFMPFFVGGMWIYMLIKKKISAKHFTLSALLFFVTALPVMLFVLINITDLPQIQILGFTIPKMYVQRFSAVTGTGENFIAGCISQFKNLYDMFINQGDGLPWNSIKGYGICYLAFVPLIVVGIIISIVERREHSFVIHWWFICSLIVATVAHINVNRINIIFIPVAYYIAAALAFIAKQHRVLNASLICICIVLFTLFGKNYIGNNGTFKHSLFYSYDQALSLAESCESEKIYIGTNINQPYILTLFYTEGNPHTYLETRTVMNPKAAFEWIESYDRYCFFLPSEIDPYEDAVYIVENVYSDYFDPAEFEITSFYNYSVAVPTYRQN